MLRNALIRMNNVLTRWRRVRVAPAQLLLLAPHCLQFTGCDRKVTNDLEACARCGQCTVSDLVGLCREYGIRGHVVGGGRRALEQVRDPAVRAVVAVACEKELWAGICAAFPKPVLAVTNRLPNGPCRDTSVDAPLVRAAIRSLLRETS